MMFPRATIRRLLLLVAALGVACGILVALQRRSERFRRPAAEYASAIHTVYFADVNGTDGTILTSTTADHHADLSEKYSAAADQPWLPLGSDPPPPDYIQAFWFAHRSCHEGFSRPGAPRLQCDDHRG